MKRFFILFLFLSQSLFAADPSITITSKSAYNGYGMVSGTVTTAEQGERVGVTLENGGLKYSTLADPGGDWAIVFRHVSTQFDV